jgi:hypothetical protein
MLEALLGVGRAIVTFAAATVRHTVRQIIEDLDRSPTAKLIHAVVKHFAPEQVRRRAEGIAEEQAELAEKQAKDGRLTSADLDRIRKLDEERDGLRQQIHANKQKHAQETLEKNRAIWFRSPWTRMS